MRILSNRQQAAKFRFFIYSPRRCNKYRRIRERSYAETVTEILFSYRNYSTRDEKAITDTILMTSSPGVPTVANWKHCSWFQTLLEKRIPENHRFDFVIKYIFTTNKYILKNISKGVCWIHAMKKRHGVKLLQFHQGRYVAY